MERDLLTKLRDIEREPVKADVFGKRDALPSEIQAVLKPVTDMEHGLRAYPPSQTDIERKDDRER